MNKTVTIGEPGFVNAVKATIKRIADFKEQKQELEAIRELLSPGFEIKSCGWVGDRASSYNIEVCDFLHKSIGARLDKINNELKQWEGV